MLYNATPLPHICALLPLHVAVHGEVCVGYLRVLPQAHNVVGNGEVTLCEIKVRSGE